jgi:hypothetical protein
MPPAAGDVPHVAAGTLADHLGILRQALFQLRHHRRRRALLRPEHRRRAARPHQRIVYVAGDLYSALPQARIQRTEIDSAQRRQLAAAPRQRLAVRAVEAPAQRLHHADATIHRGAAADAEDQVPNALIQRMQDQFAGAVAGGQQRVTARRRRQHQSAGRRHFDHRRLAVAADAVKRRHPFPQRPRGGHAHLAPAGGGHQRVHRAFAAVGDRQADALGIGINLVKAARDRPRRPLRADAFFK